MTLGGTSGMLPDCRLSLKLHSSEQLESVRLLDKSYRLHNCVYLSDHFGISTNDSHNLSEEWQRVTQTGSPEVLIRVVNPDV